MAPPRKLSEQQHEELTRLYREGATATDLAKHFGVVTKTVTRYLDLSGIPRDMSRRGEQHHWRTQRRLDEGCRFCRSKDKQLTKGVCAECRPEAQRRWHLARMGVTPEWYEKKLAEQGGVCAICGRPPKSYRLAIDHDHKCCPGRFSCSKCVRGLLCPPCNRAVGVLIDNGDPQRAIKYIEQFG